MKSALVVFAIALLTLAGSAHAEDVCPILEGRYDCKSRSLNLITGGGQYSVDEMPGKLAIKNMETGSVDIIDTLNDKDFWPRDMVQTEATPIRLRTRCFGDHYLTLNRPIVEPVRLRQNGVIRTEDWSAFLFKNTVRETEEGFELVSSVKDGAKDFFPLYILSCKKVARLPWRGTFSEGLVDNPQERPDHRALQRRAD